MFIISIYQTERILFLVGLDLEYNFHIHVVLHSLRNLTSPNP